MGLKLPSNLTPADKQENTPKACAELKTTIRQSFSDLHVKANTENFDLADIKASQLLRKQGEIQKVLLHITMKNLDVKKQLI